MLETYSRPKTKLAITAGIVLLVIIACVYYVWRALNANTNQAIPAPETASTAPTSSPSVTATQSVSDIKSDMAATNVDDVKTTLKGLKSSLSMFNR